MHLRWIFLCKPFVFKGYQILFILFLLNLSLPAFGANFVVNDNSNDFDLFLGGLCETAKGTCTLNAAIWEANFTDGPDTITFASPMVINLPYPDQSDDFSLPVIIDDGITIDGSSQWNTQTGMPGVQLNIGPGAYILKVQANNTTIKGLYFTGGGSAIQVWGDAQGTVIGSPGAGERNVFFMSANHNIVLYSSSNTTIHYNYIGNKDNTPFGVYTGTCGVYFQGGCAGTRVANNVIGNQSWAGIYINGCEEDTNLVIENNYIGVFAASNPRTIPNSVGIELVSGPYGKIRNNYINGNKDYGIHSIRSGGSVEISNNYIGSLYSPNKGPGVYVKSCVNCAIKENFIQYNEGTGLEISTSASGSFTIQGNTIKDNQGGGVYVTYANNGTIGGGTQDDGNVIYNNGSHGIRLTDARNQTVSNNSIGFSGGVFNGANQGHGILIDGSSSLNTIGSWLLLGSGGASVWDAGNSIGWNTNTGIMLDGIDVSRNSVTGNIIGRSPVGIGNAFEAPHGNHGIGIYNGAHDNDVGDADRPNVILSSKWSGIAVVNGSNNNELKVNLIGTDGQGLNWGNGYRGIHVVNSTNNQITLNKIAYNGFSNSEAGVLIDGALAFGNELSQNSIHDNGGQGIALVNGGNQSISPPALTIQSSTLFGTTSPGSMVEIYSDNGDEGRFFEKKLPVGGNGTFAWTGNWKGKYITAIVTDSNSNSSVFANPVLAPFDWNLFLPAMINTRQGN